MVNEMVHDLLGAPTDANIVLPADFNLWEEEEARQLHLLRSNLIVDRRFRRDL